MPSYPLRTLPPPKKQPENILLQALQPNEASTLPIIKIADFGLAKLVGTNDMNKASTFCGTPQYFAPEVLESRNHRKGYDSACDMWSAGVLMYILLSGSPPFSDDAQDGRPNEDTGPSSQQSQQSNRGPPGLSIFEKIREGVSSSHFAHPSWDHISQTAKLMICELLVVDPRKRLPVAMALAHPWMRGETSIDDEQRLPFSLGGSARDDIEESDDEGSGAGRVNVAFAHGSRSLQPPLAKRQRRGAAQAPGHRLPLELGQPMDSELGPAMKTDGERSKTHNSSAAVDSSAVLGTSTSAAQTSKQNGPHRPGAMGSAGATAQGGSSRFGALQLTRAHAK